MLATAALPAVALLAHSPAQADTLYWSADGTNQGGAGQWNTTGDTDARW